MATELEPTTETVPEMPGGPVVDDPALASIRPTRTSLPRSETGAALPAGLSRPFASTLPRIVSGPAVAATSTAPPVGKLASAPAVLRSPESATLAPWIETGAPGALTEAWEGEDERFTAPGELTVT